ncbi:MAG TPA: hypothetical protein G4O18_06185 [Dehalococcoidia bacterium]|nr:hypothetical protein [Dehalococcoidia bacterium]
MIFSKKYLIGLSTAIILGSAFFFLILLFMWLPDQTEEYWKSLPQALVTFATLMLAFAAFWTIKNSNEHEKHQRKERLLMQIIDWAVEVDSCAYIEDWPPTVFDSRRVILMRYEMVNARGKHISSLGRQAFSDSIQSAVCKAINTLNEYRFILATNLGLLADTVPIELERKQELIAELSSAMEQGENELTRLLIEHELRLSGSLKQLIDSANEQLALLAS